MTVGRGELVEVPGKPTIKWGGWDSTVPLPKRHVRVPITFRQSWRVDLAPLLFLFLIAALLAGGYAVYLINEHYLETGICYSKYSHLPRSGFPCTLQIGVVDFACVIFVPFAVMFQLDAVHYWMESSGAGMTVFEFNASEFRHIQLLDTINLQSITKVQTIYNQSRITGAILILANKPKLAFNTLYNWRHKGRHEFAFRTMLAATNDETGEIDLSDSLTILAALAEQARGGSGKAAAVDAAR